MNIGYRRSTSRHVFAKEKRVMKKLMIVVVLFLACAFAAFAQPRPTLGALPFTGAYGSEGDTISRLISGQHYLRDTFDVVARNMALSSIFVEREFQLSHLADPQTIARITEMLNADYIISGETVRLGGRNLLIASILHVESFRLVAGYNVIFNDIADIIDLAPSIARNLAAIASRQRSVSGVPSLAVIPFEHGSDVSLRYVETLAKIQAIEMVNTGRYIVLPRLPIITPALLEQGFQQRGYTNRAGWAELGRAMNAELVLGGSITRFGAVSLFMSEILNVETSSVVAAEQVQYRTLSDGIDLMGELVVLMTSVPGAQRDRLLSELQARQGRPIPVPGTNLTEQLAWLHSNAVSGANHIIEISGNVDIRPQPLRLPEGRSNVTITLRGVGAMRTIGLSANGSLFRVGSGITLVLDNNITLQGRHRNTHSLLWVGGVLVMKEVAIITGNVRNGNLLNTNGFRFRDAEASGVIVESGGTFRMYGGRITGNIGPSGDNGRHVPRGGSIFTGTPHGIDGHVGAVLNRGTFAMYGGTITGNTGGSGGNGGNDNRGRNANGSNGGRGAPGGVQNFGIFIWKGGLVTDNTTGRAGLPGNGGNNGTRGRQGNNVNPNVASIRSYGVIIR